MRDSKVWPVWLIIAVTFLLVYCFHIPHNQYVYNDATACALNSIMGFGTGNYINNYQFPYVLTARHVIDISPGPVWGLVCKENEFKTELGLVVIKSKSKDFAILEIIKIPQYSNITRYAQQDNEFIGNPAYYYGLPGKMPHIFLHKGVVSYRDLYDGKNFYNAFSANAHGGSSGATVFNDKGLGIGILCMSNLSGNRGTYGVYLPIEQIRESIVNSGIPEIQGILDGKCRVRLSAKFPNVILVP